MNLYPDGIPCDVARSDELWRAAEEIIRALDFSDLWMVSLKLDQFNRVTGYFSSAVVLFNSSWRLDPSYIMEAHLHVALFQAEREDVAHICVDIENRPRYGPIRKYRIDPFSTAYPLVSAPLFAASIRDFIKKLPDKGTRRFRGQGG